ncbi:MAG: hypothetical protein PVJ22_19265 [Desulfobacterales bacterium]|jgi:hypothetical protein
MADRVIFMGWNRPVAGREQQAMKLFEKSMEYWEKQKSGGQIESYEPVFLSSHGGDLNGFVMVRGEAEKLAEVQNDGTFLDLATEANYCLEGYGVIIGYVGEGATEVFTRWAKLVGG